MTLLLVTGAGASRRLGRDDSPMPLMTDWSDALCAALDDQEAHLASACHLKPGMEAEAFEKSLGLLLRWDQVRTLEERFQDLGGPQAGSHLNPVEDARQNMNRRMDVVREAINTTLYDQFGQRRVDDDLAEAAYQGLLRELGNPELIVATTNYDRATEAGLAALGHQIDTGFRPRPERTPTLEPEGIVADRTSKTPVIHLHGAVGWYERDGTVEDHFGDQRYNPSLGAPVVLYPDPDKDPTSDATVSRLWSEFREALAEAHAVLVIGHSLHDQALVQELKEIASEKKVCITYFHADEADRVSALVPGAISVEMNFGPETETETKVLATLSQG